METIKNYLDNMFSGLPKTDEMAKLKDNIYESMQDKYQELKASGKTENEAIGIVISEFGNIEELMEEFDIAREGNNKYDVDAKSSKAPTEPLPEVTMDTANEYIRLKKTAGKFVGIGVMVCVIGVAIMVASTMTMRFESGTASGASVTQALGLVIMFLFIAGGVALFVYSGFLLSPYDYLEKPFNISEYVKQQINARWSTERPAVMVKLIIGICMCVVSPIPLILSSIVYGEEAKMALAGTVILLIIVAIAVYFIISAGNEIEAHSKVLEIGDYTPKKKEDNKAIELVASIVWPIVTAIYLFMGFVYGNWHPGWVIFPITGIFFGVFAAIVEGILGK